jgi:hypothetical protein
MLVIMPLTATDLPEPVVPATRRCGILDRFTLTGAPLVSRGALGILAEADLELAARLAEAVVLEDLLQVDGLAILVRDLDADHGLARNRRDDTDGLRFQGHGQVVLELHDLAGAGARRRRELEGDDHRPHLDGGHLALHAVVGERLLQALGQGAQRGRVGLAALGRLVLEQLGGR